MEQAKATEGCPKCNGTGHIRVYQHVKAGICFSCWGTGDDLGRKVRDAHEAYKSARLEWVRTKRALRRAAPGSPQAKKYESYLHEVEEKGRKARMRLEQVLTYRNNLARQHGER